MRRSIPVIIGVIGLGIGITITVIQGPSFDSGNSLISNPKSEANVIIPQGASSPDCGKSCYVPNILKVVLGVNNTVQWTNLDDSVHSVVSDKVLFNSGMIKPNQTWIFTFLKVGNYPYHSEPGPWMKGEVIVTKLDYN